MESETVRGAASTAELIRENVRIVKLLLEGWAVRIPLRRLILYRMLTKKESSNSGSVGGVGGGGGSEQRTRLTAIHLLDAVLVNGLGPFDDPSHTPLVRGPEAALKLLFGAPPLEEWAAASGEAEELLETLGVAPDLLDRAVAALGVGVPEHGHPCF